MNAITTKYLPASNVKGSRIKATAGNGQSIIISYPHEYGEERAAAEAAIQLCIKMNWLPEEGSKYGFDSLVGGGTKDGYAFCFVRKPDQEYNVYSLPMAAKRTSQAALAG